MSHRPTPLTRGDVRYLGHRPELEACLFAIRDRDGLPPLKLETRLAALPALLDLLHDLVDDADDTGCDNCSVVSGPLITQARALYERLRVVDTPRTCAPAIRATPTMACRACGFRGDAVQDFTSTETPGERVCPQCGSRECYVLEAGTVETPGQLQEPRGVLPVPSTPLCTACRPQPTRMSVIELCPLHQKAPALLACLRTILDRLPPRHDWLDPDLETTARALTQEQTDPSAQNGAG